MKSRYSRAKNIINNLCDEKRYEFILTGKFEDVIGKYGLIVVSGLIGRLVGWLISWSVGWLFGW